MHETLQLNQFLNVPFANAADCTAVHETVMKPCCQQSRTHEQSHK